MAVIRRKVVDDLVDEEVDLFSGGKEDSSSGKETSSGGSSKKVPKKSKQVREGSPFADKKRLNLMIAGGIGIVVVTILVKVLVPLLGGSTLNYMGVFKSIFRNELGTFRYVLSVNVEDSTTEPVTEESTTETEDGDGGLQFSDWEKYSDVAIKEWEHPAYQVVVSGCVTKTEPLEMTAQVTLSTPYYAGDFTEVTCFQGSYYIDIDKMRTWLLSSKDEYLVSIGDTLPQGSRYLVVPESQLTFNSRYAEVGEDGSWTGLMTGYRRGVNLMVALIDNVIGGVGEFSGTEETASWTMSAEAGEEAVENLRKLLLRADSLVSSLAGAENAYSESQRVQALNERDNVMEALSGVVQKLTVDGGGLSGSGNARSITNGKGSQTLEGTMSLSGTFDGLDYRVVLEGSRSADFTDVMLPNGTQLDFGKFGGQERFQTLVDGLSDYFSFVPFPLEVRLAEDVGTVRDDALDGLVRLLNDSGEPVTRWSLPGYMEGHISDSEGVLPEFVEAFNGITGGLIVEREVSIEEEAAQYPDIEYSERGITYSIRYNSELSNSSLLVLDGEAINKEGEALVVDLTQFSVSTLLGSRYPANNLTLMDGMGIEDIQETLELPEKTWGSFRLYFVLSDDRGHMDLFLGNNKMGAAVEY